MPLYENAERMIRGNLAVIKRGQKPRPVAIGYLTDTQLNDINSERRKRGWAVISAEVMFVGRHVYESRVLEDGYSEEDLLAMIRSAMSERCRFIQTHKMTVLQHPDKRDGGYGCMIRDELTLECSTRFPAPELFSVVPRGDLKHKPEAIRRAAEAALLETTTNSPG